MVLLDLVRERRDVARVIGAEEVFEVWRDDMLSKSDSRLGCSAYRFSQVQPNVSY